LQFIQDDARIALKSNLSHQIHTGDKIKREAIHNYAQDHCSDVKREQEDRRAAWTARCVVQHTCASHLKATEDTHEVDQRYDIDDGIKMLHLRLRRLDLWRAAVCTLWRVVGHRHGAAVVRHVPTAILAVHSWRRGGRWEGRRIIWVVGLLHE